MTLNHSFLIFRLQQLWATDFRRFFSFRIEFIRSQLYLVLSTGTEVPFCSLQYVLLPIHATSRFLFCFLQCLLPFLMCICFLWVYGMINEFWVFLSMITRNTFCPFYRFRVLCGNFFCTCIPESIFQHWNGSQILCHRIRCCWRISWLRVFGHSCLRRFEIPGRFLTKIWYWSFETAISKPSSIWRMHFDTFPAFVILRLRTWNETFKTHHHSSVTGVNLTQNVTVTSISLNFVMILANKKQLFT